MSNFVSNMGNDADVSDEIFLARLRHWRDTELKTSDWTQLADSVCDKSAWATYRQSLRDLPASNKDARKIQLPEIPV